MSERGLLNLPGIANCFPEVPNREIVRENILVGIETVFEGKATAVILEGIEGIGKTCVLSQFARRYSRSTFSLFVRPTSRWSYDPGILRMDLCNQIEWFLSGTEIDDPEAVDDAFLRTRLFELSRRAQRKNEMLFFVVDGLDEIPDTERDSQSAILASLPLGMTKFRFLFAATEAERITEKLVKTSVAKPFPLPPLTLDETNRYVTDLNLPDDAVEEIYRTSRGLPAHLASVRRILSAGMSVEAFLEDMPQKIPDLFEIEWEQVSGDDARRVLALMSFDPRAYTVKEISAILELSEQSVEQLLARLSFVEIEAGTSTARFVSDAFMRFAQAQLQDLRVQTQDQVIEFLLRQPDERVGPTEEYVRLQVTLAEAERIDLDTSRNRLIETYFFIGEGTDDLSVSATCLAYLLGGLVAIDPQRAFEDRDELHTLVEQDLERAIDTLLTGTADHLEALQGVVRALAIPRPELAKEVALKLNTQPRRDAALIQLIDAASEGLADATHLAVVVDAIDQIIDGHFRDHAILIALEALDAERDPSRWPGGALTPIIMLATSVRDARDRCRACSLAHRFTIRALAADSDETERLANTLLTQLDVAWQAIDRAWVKSETGFRIATLLAESNAELARVYYERAQRISEEVAFTSHPAAVVYLQTLELAIRAYSGLLPGRHDTETDVVSLERLIQRVPASGEQASLWSNVALRAVTSRRFELSKQIVSERVRPLLEQLSKEDHHYRSSVLIRVAPALCSAHLGTAIQAISDLSVEDCDDAYSEICRFMLRGVPPGDPYEQTESEEYAIGYEEALDILQLAERIDQDAAVYVFLAAIAQSATSTKGRRRVSEQQRTELARRIEELAPGKFPNQKHIKHDGYAILARGLVHRLRRDRGKAWQDLLERARSVPNTADEAYVMAILACLMPDRDRMTRRDALLQALQRVESIPSVSDRLDRYLSVAGFAMQVDSSIARRSLDEGMKLAVHTNRPDVYKTQRRMIDLAYRLDPTLASSLASLADNDEARVNMRQQLRRRVELLELKKRFADGAIPTPSSGHEVKRAYPRVAWMLLGALNAGRVAPVHIEKTRDVIDIAGQLPLDRAYPLLAWFIENAVKRYSGTNEATTILRALFEATVLGAELCARMATRASKQVHWARRRSTHPQDQSSLLVGPRERSAALEFIRSWLSEASGEHLKICDPYFGPEDLELLQLVRSLVPGCTISILTSERHQNNLGIDHPWDRTYRDYWRLRVSDQDPPPTEVVIVGTAHGRQSPIHDRWWVMNGYGLHFGTSFNSLGRTGQSDVIRLPAEDAAIREAEIDRYLQRLAREYSGQRLVYTSFTL